MLASSSNDEVKKFTYLASVVSTTGGTDQYVGARLGEVRSIFTVTNQLLKINIIRRGTKVKIFHSNVKVVLLYASELWAVTR